MFKLANEGVCALVGLFFEQDKSKARKGLEIYLKVLGPDHPSTATSYNNIGAVYKNQGDYEKALAEYRKGLEIQLKVLGHNHPSTAGTYYNIAWAYDAKDDLNNALPNFQTSFDVYSKIFGPDHSMTIKALGQIDRVSGKM